MMRVLMINSVCGIKSTGRICVELAAAFEAQGHEVKIAYGREQVPQEYQKYAVKIGNAADFFAHTAASMLFDAHGLASVAATKKFLQWAEQYNPDLLWLHNIHGYFIHYPLLFEWIKSRPSMQVRWTLHDCWAFTGHCSYFTLAGCDKWKTGCEHCPQAQKYPARLFFDNSKRNYQRKKEAFCGVQQMTVITPSRWLAALTRESFLQDYPVEVVYNRVDETVFHPAPSEFRREHSLEGKHIILGVASPWDERKGLDDFIKLSALISDNYRIVLVGLSKQQCRKLPENVLGLERTDSAEQLAAIYSAADVFVNPTYEDNYPSTNLEAKACGTPVITYNTGGSPESVSPENVISCGDVKALWQRIQEIVRE